VDSSSTGNHRHPSTVATSPVAVIPREALDVDCMQTTIGKQMCVMELAEEDTRRGLHRVLLHHDH
jgi:hypothetical protein